MALPNGDLITTPFDPQMAYPSDRRMQVDTLNSRDSISMFIRWEGMTVYVLEDSKIYILQGGRSNEYWKELGTGAGTGGTTFVGQFPTADLLPTSGRSAGDYAFVGTGDDFVQYNWDNIGNQWVMAEGQTDMASEFFHIGYKTPLRRPVIFPLLPKDVLVQESGDFVFAPETAVARFIFVGEVTAIRGIETAAAYRENKYVNRTGSDIILRDKASGIPSGSGMDFGGTDYTWVNGSEITLKGNGTYWELAPNNQIAFSDHLDSVNAEVSVGSDGMDVITGIIDKITKETISIEETNEFVDGTSMDDSKVDGYYYFKALGKYFVRSTFKKHQTINIKDLGAKGDSFDNAPIFEILEEILLNIKKPVHFPPNIYTSSRNLTIPEGVDVIMEGDAVIYYTGTVFPALKIGTGSLNRLRKFRLSVTNSTLSSWEDSECIGIEIVNLYDSELEIKRADNFTEGVRLTADSSGFVYNRTYLGRLQGNKIGLKLLTRNGGWINENLFFGGRFNNFSGTHVTKTRYGIWITSEDGSYENNNNNNFYKPSFEINQPSTEIDCVPIVIENGANNKFVDARSEGNGIVVGRTLNLSYNNMFDFGYGPNSGRIEDLGANPSSKLNIRNVWYNNPGIGFEIYNSGDLTKKSCEYDSTNTYFSDEIFCGGSTSATIEKYITGIEIGANGLNIGSSRCIGVRVSTSLNSRFLISKVISSSGSPGRTMIRCYDASGTILTGSSDPYVKSSIASTPNYTPSYGGVYRQGTDSLQPMFIVCRPEVAYIDVLFSGGTNLLAGFLGFSIRAIDRVTSVISPFTKKGLYSSQKPTSLNYEVGTIIYSASVGVLGWKYNGSGIWEEYSFSKPDSVVSSTNNTLTATAKNFYRRYTGATGTTTINADIHSIGDEHWGEIEGGDRTFVAGAGVTLRAPVGQGLVAPTGSKYIIKFKSPNDALVTIIKPYDSATTFNQLTDTPASKTGNKNKTVKVSNDETTHVYVADGVDVRDITDGGSIAPTLTDGFIGSRLNFTSSTAVTLQGFTSASGQSSVTLVNPHATNNLTLVHNGAGTVKYIDAGATDLVIAPKTAVKVEIVGNEIYRVL